MEIKEIREKMCRRKTIESQLESLEEQCRLLKHKEYELKCILDKEASDVEKLNRLSWSSICLAVFGNKEERLEKEQQEVYAAMAKHRVVEEEVQAAQEHIGILRKEYNAGRYLEADLEEAIRIRAKELKENKGAIAEEVMKLEEEIDTYKLQLKEVKEAISAGLSVETTISAVEAQLNKASNWGIYDVLGGGIIGDVMKHERLNTSQNLINQLQLRVRRFKTELADVKMDVNINVTIDGALKFADMFFDNIFSDWMVLDKINNSKQQVASTKVQVRSTLANLSKLESKLQNNIEEKKTRLEELLS